jgi:uncharacterized protein
MVEPLDARYVQGIEYFNRHAFFHAHEVWEDLWQETQGPARQFYQGLIQVAVCLHHFRNGNLRGACKLYHSSTEYLRAYAPRYAGLDVAGLLHDLAACCAELLEVSAEELPALALTPGRLPRCRLSL